MATPAEPEQTSFVQPENELSKIAEPVQELVEVTKQGNELVQTVEPTLELKMVAEGECAEVIVAIASADVDRIFHYAVPGEMRASLTVGYRVAVPFGKGNKSVEGYVIGFSAPMIEMYRIKAITAILDPWPVLTSSTLELAKWMREKYYTTLSVCLRCVTPPESALRRNAAGKKRVTLYAHVNENFEVEEKARVICAKGGSQAKVLELLTGRGYMALPELTKEAGVSMSPVHTLVRNGLVTLSEIAEASSPPQFEEREKPARLTLTDEQEMAVARLLAALRSPAGKAYLIHGVTGSGKTEIYMRLIEEAMKDGKQAIMLVPEISLTPQAVEVFKRRFGELVAVTHSRLTPMERLEQWRKAREGAVSVIIGPRSALFTVFEQLGVIIVDEEHEKTYVSETSPKYDVGEVARKLSEITGALAVFGSATPGVDTYYRAGKGEIELITLTRRVNNRFPDVRIVDMRNEMARGNRSIFSEALRDAIGANIENSNQTILFLNRRGHSTFVSCRSCGYVLECEKCSVNYTYHIYSNTMMCHYCGASEKPPDVCPICGSKHIRFFGAGTQKIEEEVARLFPGVPAIRMDMDTTGKKNSHENLIRRFAGGEARILIGTQMIAKGHDFPNVSLVGIVDADTALNMGDFRSAETAFQLITQVSGRAGRADIPGKVYIQTYNPEHYAVAYGSKGDYKAFYEREIALRKQMGYPPFSNIFMALMSCADEKRLVTAQTKLAQLMRFYNRKGFFDILGPAPAIVSKINSMYRWKILVKGKDEELLKQFVFYCVDKLSASFDLEGVNMNLTLNPRMIN